MQRTLTPVLNTAQFHKIKRRVYNVLRDDVYDWCEGSTDSEACFALLLSLLDPSELAHGGPIKPELLQVLYVYTHVIWYVY